MTRARASHAAALMLAGFAHASPAASAPATGNAEIHVTIRDHTFVPSVVHAKSGQAIVFTNTDQDPHTVTSGGKNLDDGRWKSSPLIADGETFTLHVTKPGTYPFFCVPHQFQDSMHGSIVVTR